MLLVVKAAAVAVMAVIVAAGAATAAAAPRVYVGLFRDDAVAVIDTSTNTVLRTVPVPKGPHGLVVTRDGAKVYVSSDGDSTVSVIDTSSDRVVRSVDVGANPHGLAISADGSRVMVSGFGSNQVLFIDTASDQVVGRVSIAQPHNGALSADGRLAWVGSQQQGATALVLLDVPAQKEVARVALDRTPRALDLSPDGRRLFFTVAGQAAVLVLDTTSRQIVAQIPVGASPHQAPPTADGWALAVSQGPGELGLIDTATSAVAGTVAVGKTPHWVGSSSDGTMAYVTNEGSNDVSVVRLASRTVVATIAVGNAPRKVAVQPGAITTAAAPGASDVALRVDDYFFEPKVIQGRAGQPLRLRIDNAASTLHNLSIPRLGIDRDLPPKSRVELDVMVPRSGPIEFFCKFHGPLGQQGQLLVDPPGS
jgi:YVTN family beta-propeller protein